MQNSSHIEGILPLINKPGRYTNNELNAVHKDWDQAEVRLALAFPDLYEIGMSGLGLAILYTIVNKLPYALAERSYSADIDLEAKLREQNIPLWAWESKRPLKDFDILGITLQTELGYTNVLNMLDLAQVPIRSIDRREGHPIVIGGGSCCANPEPMAPFFDCFVIGDGEEVIIEICQAMREAKKNKEDRKQKIERLAKISGVYVPAIHSSSDSIKKRTIPNLKIEDAPHPPIVPLVEVTHDRFTVEITRGCTRGCRFCQAGMIYRPVRYRSQEDIVKLAKEGIAASGWDDISLLSLSTNDYPDFLGLLNKLNGCFASRRVSISVPSLRLDSFNQEVALALKKIKKSGLTFAPEAGSQRLRDVINKGLSDDDLLAVIKLAKGNGWKMVKLYFMIGLPTETQEDLDAMIALCRKAAGFGISIKVAVSPFVPKPQTPFQWEAQDDLQVIRDKIGHLNKGLKSARVQFKWHDPESSALEGILSRGDRKLSAAIEAAWRKGCKFDQWSEHFSWLKWQEALTESGTDSAIYTGARDTGQPLAWGHIDYGVKQQFLLAERERAHQNFVTPDCRIGDCTGCGIGCRAAGLSKDENVQEVEKVQKIEKNAEDDGFGRARKMLPQAAPLAKTRFRLKYTKGPEIKFISHLDMTRVWLRAISRARLPIAYSQGFSPHPKVSFGPPLPLGITSRGEYMDIQLDRPASAESINDLNKHLPRGMEISAVKPIMSNARSISELAEAADYMVKWQGDAAAIRSKFEDQPAWPIRIMKKSLLIEADIRKQVMDIILAEGGFIVRLKMNVSGAKIGQIVNALTGQDIEKGQAIIERIDLYSVANKNVRSIADG
ncbi:MAG: TIGR03960 family B12-binding radical SAM protein [Candidatus Edwardsbacteria bacterium]|nr:TIGR03960 family B12-binding radical SAM protein [Candidatus Edwardsbacteria bacterium]MBU1575710.1 TIGR03960 family B12-binding radical SAM protein [Candidatus Edwardsbacteria bacterium]MBU2464105.1 TIGR03960 family B12-binding radical SAM protein [Candidatus Edwardsbacteria bacterium]MBU2594675.1 TIGR03960 family B12-binding radical SAM protein [Candidatus Edwardsbacteria bacterium]